MNEEPKYINSIQEFIEIALNKANNDCFTYLYRGQREYKPLMPKILRNKYIEREKLIETERIVFEEFKRKSIAYLEVEPSSELEWLAIGQHYGLETRLLDWTENALTALWFCVNKPLESGDGVIYCVSSFNGLNYVTENEINNPFQIKGVKIYKPSFINTRIINQTSVFTVHEINKESTAEKIEKDIVYIGIKKYLISSRNFERIKKKLNILGVNSSTVFPDLIGLCESINESIKDKEAMSRKSQLLRNFIGEENYNNISKMIGQRKSSSNDLNEH